MRHPARVFFLFLPFFHLQVQMDGHVWKASERPEASIREAKSILANLEGVKVIIIFIFFFDGI